MADGMLSLSSGFDEATEADWLAAVEKALKGGPLEKITRTTRDELKIRPLYRETDFASGQDLRGTPGEAPFLRGKTAAPDPYLPWDIRQSFAHPDPSVTRNEILRDLERGVTSIELAIDGSGQAGCVVSNLDQLTIALEGVRADIAAIGLDPRGAGSGAAEAALLALWAQRQDRPASQKLAFNISPVRALMRTGHVAGGIDAAMKTCAALVETLATFFPDATSLVADGRIAHEAGASEAQELAILTADGVDTLRRLDAQTLSPKIAAQQLVFKLSVDANYGIGIAKLRAARRLWARVEAALNLPAQPMMLHAVTSARMLTRYDAWVNMLRGTAACFAAASGGADIITVRAFNERFGVPEELGRRIARNTQIMAMEESGLGRVADPSGGAWFTERFAEDLAQAAWAEFQQIEREGGLVESLVSGHVQTRIAEKRNALINDAARRKVPVTGVSEFPLLDEISAPIAVVDPPPPEDQTDTQALATLLPELSVAVGDDTLAEPLEPMHIAAPFEALRDRSEAFFEETGARPKIFLATLGPLAEHTARADFARNFFAAGGIEAKIPPVPPKSDAERVAALKASGCEIAVLCGADKRYGEDADAASKALKQAGLAALWLAGKFEAPLIDRHIFVGCDMVHELTVALAELGVQ